MARKKAKKRLNPWFPEGAVSGSMITKINEIHISRALDDGGVPDLANVIGAFSEGKVLEFIGQMKKARETFLTILKKNPRNRWAREALSQVERTLN